MREQLSRRIQEQGLTKTVEMLGWVDDAVQEVLPHIDIFVQTSHWEAMCIVILEAMGAGKPIVATAVGDNRHVIDRDEVGLVVASGDLDQFIEKLDRLVENVRLRREISRNAYERYLEIGTAEAMVKNYEQLYRDVFDQGRKGKDSDMIHSRLIHSFAVLSKELGQSHYPR